MAKSSAAIGLVFVVSSCGTHPQTASESNTSAKVEVVPQTSVIIPVADERPSRRLVEEKVTDRDSRVTSERAGGLRVEDITSGQGGRVSGDETMIIHYVGSLPNGTVFDSSRDRGPPFRFRGEQVIRGLAQGMEGMRIGGMRRITIPPALGYGDRKLGNIPPGSTLIFEVELLGIE